MVVSLSRNSNWFHCGAAAGLVAGDGCSSAPRASAVASDDTAPMFLRQLPVTVGRIYRRRLVGLFFMLPPMQLGTAICSLTVCSYIIQYWSLSALKHPISAPARQKMSVKPRTESRTTS